MSKYRTTRLLDVNEFLSDYGIRTLAKYYEQNPYTLVFNGGHFTIEYSPGESTTDLFGGNSKWRGSIWLPLNFLIIESLRSFHDYYRDELRIEFPRGKGEYLTLNEINNKISKRLSGIFLRDKYGRRAVFGENEKLQNDSHFNNNILFHYYFHDNTAKGLGASHQTRWTALIANLLHPFKKEFHDAERKEIIKF